MFAAQIQENAQFALDCSLNNLFDILGPNLKNLKKALTNAMKNDFLPYKKMKEIFEKQTSRDPVIWALATGRVWVLRLAFNCGLRKRDLDKDHWAVAFHKADKGMIMELLYILNCVDTEDIQG